MMALPSFDDINREKCYSSAETGKSVDQRLAKASSPQYPMENKYLNGILSQRIFVTACQARTAWLDCHHLLACQASSRLLASSGGRPLRGGQRA